MSSSDALCPLCRRSIDLSGSHSGERITCPQCVESFTVVVTGERRTLARSAKQPAAETNDVPFGKFKWSSLTLGCVLLACVFAGAAILSSLNGSSETEQPVVSQTPPPPPAPPLPTPESEAAPEVEPPPVRPAETPPVPHSIYDRILRSTVWVICPLDGNEVTMGTGAIVDKRRRLVITNDHVADRDELFVFLPMYRDDELVTKREDYYREASRYQGRVVARAHEQDLALIQLQSLPSDSHEIALAADSARPSEEVHTVGNPGASGALWIYTSGRVRQVYDADYSFEGHRVRARIAETDSAINEGDSGGPVVNADGELVAVNQSVSVNARLVSNCIDITEIREFLDGYTADATP